jgi:myo-inositol 2-dehydrogenase/D-chiro-inositol 1-dehydrogenase
MMIGDSRQTPVRRYDRLGVHEDHQFFFLERFAAAYEAEMLSFLDAMSKDIEVAVTGADGRTALALAEAAVRSRRLGRPVPFNERGAVPALAADQRMTIRA